MKDDSLLSNLSNVSYHASNSGIDFFNESGPGSVFNELKAKDQAQQYQVDLNCLPLIQQNQPITPKQNALLAAYWGNNENGIQGSSDIQLSEIHQQKQQQQQVKEGPLTVLQEIMKDKKKQPQVKIQQQFDDQFDNEQIGTMIKNQTKNIPKNYGKAIITYIQKERSNFQYILKEHGIEYEQLMSQLSKKKKYINTIANLRDLWIDFKYARCMRILSNQFLRKFALQYIFNSRICNYTSHVKYRKRLQQAIQSPNSFRHIKQY